MKALALAVCAGVAALVVGAPVLAADWFPYNAEQVTPPFDPDGKVSPVEYVPL